MDENRLINLEIKFLHQEQLLEDLHKVIYEQQQFIDTLNSKIISLEKKITDLGDDGLEIRGNEKPPHY